MAKILRNHYVLAVHDLRSSARFFVDAMGFQIVGEPPGWVFVERDNCMIMIGECPDDMHPSELGCHSYFGYLRVDDADALHAHLKATGLAPRLGEISDQPWGMREFGLTTPDGHRITIGNLIAT